MDIQNLKYNRELMKTKSRLEKEINMVNQELINVRNNCNHVRVFIGQESSSGKIYNECLFCGLKELSCDLPFQTIVAYCFKSNSYGTGEKEEERKNRMEELRNLYIEFCQKNEYDEDEIINEFTKRIERGLL